MDPCAPIPSEVDAAALFSGMPSPESVRALEQQLMGFPQVDLSTNNLVHGGMCARTIFIPAGTILTGAQTNIGNICVLFGDITVTTDGGPKRLSGFNVIPANAGFKRAGIAHADTWWATLWPTDQTDLISIEDEMTNESAALQTRRAGIELVRPLVLPGED